MISTHRKHDGDLPARSSCVGGIARGTLRAAIFFFCAWYLAAGLIGCTASLPFHRSRLTILSYNVQNLFDDHTDGCEYAEYDPSRGEWGTAEYYARLENLSTTIRSSVQGGPDIVALQEIEHAEVLVDLRERFLGGLGYRYVCAATHEGSPITVGVLSRLPVVSTRAHGAHVEGGYPLRPVLEAEIQADRRTLTLFVCHWKSKLGGARETEPLRLASAAVIADRIRELEEIDPSRDVVVAGDLNEPPGEYRSISGAYQTALVPVGTDVPESWYGSSLFVAGGSAVALDFGVFYARMRVDTVFTEEGAGDSPSVDPAGTDGDSPVCEETSGADGRSVPDAVVLWSPWEESDEQGSYAFRGVWERIDQFLVSPSLFDGDNIEYEDFTTIRDERLLDGDGFPLRWQSYSLTGCSDHLPIMLELSL